MSSSDLEYPRDVESFGITFDKVLMPLLNERLELHRKLDDFIKANNSSVPSSNDSESPGQTFRVIAQEILDSEKKVSQVLSLRTPPAPSPPPQLAGAPGSPGKEPIDKPIGGVWIIVILFAFGLLVVSLGCFGGLKKTHAGIIIRDLSQSMNQR